MHKLVMFAIGLAVILSSMAVLTEPRRGDQLPDARSLWAQSAPEPKRVSIQLPLLLLDRSEHPMKDERRRIRIDVDDVGLEPKRLSATAGEALLLEIFNDGSISTLFWIETESGRETRHVGARGGWARLPLQAPQTPGLYFFNVEHVLLPPGWLVVEAP